MLVKTIIFGLLVSQTFTYTLINVGDEVSSVASQVARTSLRKKRSADEALLISGSSEENPSASVVHNCALDCMQAMDTALDKAFPEVNISSLKTHSKTVFEDYDPKKFDKFCSTYKPGRKCLDQCPADDPVKSFAQNGLKMVDMMCITKYDAFKKNLPCMNSISTQIRDKCDPQCAKYEESFNKLESFGESDDSDPTSQMSVKDLREVFKGSCLYVQCLMQCGNPVTKLKCGKEAADLEKTTLVSGFSSVTDMLSSFNDTSVDFWPQECRSLGNA